MLIRLICAVTYKDAEAIGTYIYPLAGIFVGGTRQTNLSFERKLQKKDNFTDIIPNKNQNTRHKSFLFPFFCVKNYFYSLLRQAQHKLQYKEFLPCKRKIYYNLFIENDLKGVYFIRIKMETTTVLKKVVI